MNEVPCFKLYWFEVLVNLRESYLLEATEEADLETIDDFETGNGQLKTIFLEKNTLEINLFRAFLLFNTKIEKSSYTQTFETDSQHF